MTVSNGWTKMREEFLRLDELCEEYQVMIEELNKMIDKKNERIDKLVMKCYKLEQQLKEVK